MCLLVIYVWFFFPSSSQKAFHSHSFPSSSPPILSFIFDITTAHFLAMDSAAPVDGGTSFSLWERTSIVPRFCIYVPRLTTCFHSFIFLFFSQLEKSRTELRIRILVTCRMPPEASRGTLLLSFFLLTYVCVRQYFSP